MKGIDVATELALLDLRVLEGAGVDVDPEITNEVLLARVGPEITRDRLRPLAIHRIVGAA